MLSSENLGFFWLSFRLVTGGNSTPERVFPLEWAWRKMVRRFSICAWRLLVLLLAVSGACLSAQEKPASPQPQTTETAPNPAKTELKDKEANDEVPKRIFWIIPNFMTANDQPQNQGPLTPKQKFNIAWHQWWDISAHIGNLVQAGISQAANGIPEYGQ